MMMIKMMMIISIEVISPVYLICINSYLFYNMLYIHHFSKVVIHHIKTLNKNHHSVEQLEIMSNKIIYVG